MISESEIKEWWNKKLANYIQNNAGRNNLTIVQDRAIFFHKKPRKIPRISSARVEEIS